MACVGLLWLGRIVVACLHREATNSFELCLYPRYHLDESSLLCRLPLPDRPIAMDTWQDYILVATMPFDIRVFHIHVDGELSPLSTPPVRVRVAGNRSDGTIWKLWDHYLLTIEVIHRDLVLNCWLDVSSCECRRV